MVEIKKSIRRLSVRRHLRLLSALTAVEMKELVLTPLRYISVMLKIHASTNTAIIVYNINWKIVPFPCSSYLFLCASFFSFHPSLGCSSGASKLKKPGNRREGGEFATYMDPISQMCLGGSNPSEDTSMMSINLPPEHFTSYKDRTSQMHLLENSKGLDGRTFVSRLTSEDASNV